MADRQWTKPQSDAIHAWGGSLLVSAAAGSGKTAVLVERAVSLIQDEDRQVPADRLLVVTFSNAAAAEMKQRMHARLSALIARQPGNLYLQRQQALLAGAQISTVHSFCLELIRQNFHHLDISPDFTLADESELAILREECALQSIEEFYDMDDDGSFAALVDLLSTGRDDRRLVETMLRIYEFARSHPFYRQWLEGKERMYDTRLPVAETVWGKVLLDYGLETLEYCRDSLERALEDMAGDEALEKGYYPAFQSDLTQVVDCLKALKEGDWDKAVTLLRGFHFARLGAVRGDDPAKERAKGVRERGKKLIGDLRDKHLNALEEDFRSDISDLQPKIRLLFDLVREFDTRFRQAKGDKRRLDFSDLEHLALELLVEPEGDSYRRTGIAQEISLRYEVVMVDEYQDTNEVQDMIFTCVSQSQQNLFMVGDVKQSIYSFRQAMPEIFLAKKARFFPYDSERPCFPAKISLDTNFRSRREVTEGVNYLFRLMMSKDIGDMEYTVEESLKCGATYPEAKGMVPELLLADLSQYQGDRDPTQVEADLVADKIASMVESGFSVTGADGVRSARPGDFCILLRSPKDRGEVYVRALAERGIPAWTETTGGYLETREISAVVSLLESLDNPLLDVELAAAMLSPLFDFTDDDLAAIRLECKGQPFYIGVRLAADEGNEKCVRFLDVFQKLRQAAALLPADKLILRLYDLTTAIPVFRAMPMGEVRTANLLLLVDYARQYHSMGYKRLGGFVGFLGRLKERDGDLSPAANTGDGASGVRVMSVHRSKGLEFPVVFLSDIFRQFNKTDLRAGTLLHSRLGFACVRREEETRKQYPTVPMQAIRLEMERSMLSEELRVLYVALTRAKEKLILTGGLKQSPEKKLSGLHSHIREGRLPTRTVREAACIGDWLLMALLHHPTAVSLRELAGTEEEQPVPDSNDWGFSIQAAEDRLDEDTLETDNLFLAEQDRELAELIRRRAAFRYPYQDQTVIPTKLAVSAVAKGKTDPSHRFAARPKFMSHTKLTAAEKGNALHKFMQFADYEKARDSLEEEVRRMGQQSFLTETEVASLSLPRLRKFFGGALAGRIFASPRVLRELKFTAECGKEIVGEYIQNIGEADKIVLQGVADCVFFEDGKAVIVDYKTDAVKEPDELVRRYTGQLRLYRGILGKSLGVPVKQCLLYSFALGREIVVE